MTEESRQYKKLVDNDVCDLDDVMLIDNDALCDSLIGITTDGRAVYDYEKMVDEFMNNEGWDDIEAMEYIDYNIVRALPYYYDKAPVIIFPFV